MLSERIHWLDVARGILILLVIFSHLTESILGHRILSSFFMPAFFLLAGMTMHSEPFALFLRKKAKSILISYFCFSLILIAYKTLKSFLFHRQFDVIEAFQSIFLLYPGRTGGTVYELWFLPCLFFAYLIAAEVLFAKAYWQKAVSVLCFVFCFFSVFAVGEKGIFICVVAVSSFFVVSGFLLKNFLIRIMSCVSYTVVVLICACFISGIGICFNSAMDFAGSRWGNLFIYIPTALAGSFACFLLCKLIGKNIYLEYIGRNSLYFYALHYLFTGMPKTMNLTGTWKTPLAILVVICLTIPAVEGYKYCEKKLGALCRI